MTATAPWPFVPTAERACYTNSSGPPQPGAHRSDCRESFRGLLAGPGLSAVEMAAACLCLADAVWHPPAVQPVPADGHGLLHASGVTWNG